MAGDEKDKPGSSPRMRGARYADGRHLPLVGIIPADAGSTKWVVSPYGQV